MSEKLKKGFKHKGWKLGEKVIYKGGEFEIIGFNLNNTKGDVFIAIVGTEQTYSISESAHNVAWYRESEGFSWVSCNELSKIKEYPTLLHKIFEKEFDIHEGEEFVIKGRICNPYILEDGEPIPQTGLVIDTQSLIYNILTNQYKVIKLPKKKKITIDGKTIEISKESFDELKKQLMK